MNIDKTYELDFPVQSVYAAWVSSATVISPATAMDIDPIVGGHYILLIESPQFTAKSQGEFLLVEPEKQLRYTWEWNRDGEQTEIDVGFKETDRGTQIRIVHSGFQKRESLEAHSDGWDSYIDGFVQYLGR